MNILVTGGAGYIGSATTKALLDAKHRVTVIDNLLKGNRRYLDPRATFVEGSILDATLLDRACAETTFDAIMHFAALKDAGESMKKPELYSEHNIAGTIAVGNAALRHGIKKIIFSSTAAVYGDVMSGVASETTPCQPSNYYGFSKLIGEQTLAWYQKLSGIETIALRYFNVAGDAGLGYVPLTASNLFNLVADVAGGAKDHIDIYGTDYDTPDGTGVRDYIHVADVVDAHIRALNVAGSHQINLGSQHGYSVLEIITMFEKVTGKTIKTVTTPRRAGDIARLTADAQSAQDILGWTAHHSLEDMVRSTWESYVANK